MCTARSLPYRGSLSEGSLSRRPLSGQRPPPGQRVPWRDIPWTETPFYRDPQKEHGTWQPDRKWHHTEWLTRACENITLSQTSFAGGNNRLVPNVESWFHPSGKSWICHREVLSRSLNVKVQAKSLFNRSESSALRVTTAAYGKLYFQS